MFDDTAALIISMVASVVLFLPVGHSLYDSGACLDAKKRRAPNGSSVTYWAGPIKLSILSWALKSPRSNGPRELH